MPEHTNNAPQNMYAGLPGGGMEDTSNFRIGEIKQPVSQLKKQEPVPVIGQPTSINEDVVKLGRDQLARTEAFKAEQATMSKGPDPNEIPEAWKFAEETGLPYSPRGESIYEPPVIDSFIHTAKTLSETKKQLRVAADKLAKMPDTDQGAKAEARKKQERIVQELKELVEFERTRLKGFREEMAHDIIEQVDGLHDEMLGYQDNYPYSTKYGAGFIDNVHKKIAKELEIKIKSEKLDEETTLVLKEMREFGLWANGAYNMLEGLSSAMKAYYDGENQANSLYTMYKRIVMKDFRKYFGKELKGASLTENQKTKLKEWGYITNKEKRTLREEVVAFNDDQMFWNMAAASAGQWDYEATYQHEKVMNLSSRQLEFMQKMLGAGDGKNPLNYTQGEWIKKGVNADGSPRMIPETIMSWFAIDKATDENEDALECIMEVLLEKNIKARLDSNESIDDLVAEVKTEARIRAANIDAPKNLDKKLSSAVFNQNIIMMQGFMVTGELGWRFDQIEDVDLDAHLKKLFGHIVDADDRENKEAEFIYLNRDKIVTEKRKVVGPVTQEVKVFKDRKMEQGSIYTAFDVATVYNWMYHKILYDGRAEDRSTLMLPSVGEFRKMFDHRRPDWTLDIHKYCQEVGDTETLRLLDWMEHNPWESVSMRGHAEEVFGKINPEFLRFFNENISAFLVPMTDQTMEIPGSPTKKKKKVWLPMPVPIPGALDDFNFFRVMGGTKDSSTRHGAKDTFYERLLRQEVKPSEINWSGVTRQAFDGWRVTTAQKHKWLIFLIGSHELDGDKKQAFDLLLGGDAKGIAFKNLDKRFRLGDRLLLQKTGVWNMAVVPFLIALGAAKKTGLLGRDFYESAELFDSNHKLKDYRELIGEWANVAADMPGDAYGIENFNGTMAFMIYFYAKALIRISDANKENYGKNRVQSVATSRTILNTKLK